MAERDAAGDHVVEPHYRHRSIALRRRTRPTRRSIAISYPTSVRTSIARAIGQDLAGDLDAVFLPTATFTSSKKIRCDAGCSLREPSAARSCRSMTATTGSRCN